MKRFLSLLLLVLMLCGLSVAQSATDEPSVQYITQYQLTADNSPVYGLFDIGEKPSVRLVTGNINGGTLKLQLHGRHYLEPIAKTFSMSVTFEDVTGRVFQQSSSFGFVQAKQATVPRWFLGLENIAGLYGNQTIDIPVPPGTSVINLVGDDGGASPSPNQLVGYVSHIQLP